MAIDSGAVTPADVPTIYIPLQSRLDAVLKEFGDGERRRGFEQGLEVAYRIRSWLSSNDAEKRLREICGWADKAIERARSEGPQ